MQVNLPVIYFAGWMRLLPRQNWHDREANTAALPLFRHIKTDNVTGQAKGVTPESRGTQAFMFSS